MQLLLADNDMGCAGIRCTERSLFFTLSLIPHILSHCGNFLAFSTVIRFGLNAFVFVLGERTRDFIVGLTDVSPAIAAPVVWNYDVCFQYPGFVGNAATVYMPCTSAMPPRRYLIVQLEAYQFLNFCEIEVYVLGELIFVCRLVCS